MSIVLSLFWRRVWDYVVVGFWVCDWLTKPAVTFVQYPKNEQALQAALGQIPQ